MSLFFISPEDFLQESVTLGKEDSKHISKVLRLKESDQITIRDGLGNEADGILTSISPTSVEVLLNNKRKTEIEDDQIQIDLFQGVPKQGKMEQIVQRTTEIGVNQIYPFYAHRSVVKPTKSDTKKTERYQRIAYEAAKQSKRGIIPKVSTPLDLKEVLSTLEDYDLILLAYELEDTKSLKDILENSSLPERPLKVALIIGPEGGFTEEEVQELTQRGAHAITLGKFILRTETAGMALLSQLKYALNL